MIRARHRHEQEARISALQVRATRLYEVVLQAPRLAGVGQGGKRGTAAPVREPARVEETEVSA